ncbi:membrane-anchored junction protein [Tachyglossus aculeatus]|uniref:membrane-anchored junction protein n=1 Tax=Tachyglossus aculeatus TaxID=9261 RepID=UPI0018F5376E|nr:membrane-anchored junction protein [Tachyglossus aculeatus]XP_038620910.1 membrane-anchored junction protein [Tachyglossus aculeatus]
MSLKEFSFPFSETRFLHDGVNLYKFKIRYGSNIRVEDLDKEAINHELEESIRAILGDLDNIQPFGTKHFIIFPYKSLWERASHLRFKQQEVNLIPYPYVFTLYVETKPVQEDFFPGIKKRQPRPSGQWFPPEQQQSGFRHGSDSKGLSFRGSKACEVKTQDAAVMKQRREKRLTSSPVMGPDRAGKFACRRDHSPSQLPTSSGSMRANHRARDGQAAALSWSPHFVPAARASIAQQGLQVVSTSVGEEQGASANRQQRAAQAPPRENACSGSPSPSKPESRGGFLKLLSSLFSYWNFFGGEKNP